jgi:ATP-binding cassette subfamily B protein
VTPRTVRRRLGLRAFAGIAWRAGPLLTGGVIGAVAVATAAALLGVTAAGAAVGRVPGVIAYGLGSSAGRAALAWTVVCALGFVVQRAAAGLQAAAATALGARIDARLQRRLMDAVMAPSGLRHLEDPATLDLIGVGRETFRGGWARPGRIASTGGGLVAGYLSLAGACVVLARFRPAVGIVLFAAGAWAAYEDKVASRVEAAHHYGSSTESRRAEYLYELGVNPPAAKEVRIFGLSRFVRDGYRRVWRRSMAGVLARPGPRPAAATSVLGLVALGALVWVCRAAFTGDVPLGPAAGYVQVVILVPLAVQQASWTGLQTELGLATLNRYQEAVDAVAAGEAPPGRGAAGLPRAVIRFGNVTFTYPGAYEPALRDLNLDIPAGESLAIVGVNGAGKTTLIKLLCRLYEPTSGRITVDGIDLADLDLDAWRTRIAPVFQDPTRFPVSARANVEFGRPSATGHEQAVAAAAERAGIRPVVEALPHGWETPLSAEYADGADLSGGEWQRMAMARAFFAVDHGAGVLVLDEPAAHLDARAEADLYDRFLTITRGLTTVVISHRFSTVRRATSIVVLDAGGVLEQGSHKELLALDGTYATMFRLQAARFTDRPETESAG